MGDSNGPVDEYVRMMHAGDPGDERWRNCKPTPEKDMTFIGSRLTVCEFLRRIYIRTNDPEIKLWCRMATTMAKAMAVTITGYKGRHWGREFYPWNPARRHDRLKAKYDKAPEGEKGGGK